MDKKLLRIDAIINIILGILLLLLIPFPHQLPEFLGVPAIDHGFYPSIMGGVFVGIGIGLLLESNRTNPDQIVGLGLGAAIAINLSGGVVLVGWLLFGELDLPVRGNLFLWTLAVLLIVISSIELITHQREKSEIA